MSKQESTEEQVCDLVSRASDAGYRQYLYSDGTEHAESLKQVGKELLRLIESDIAERAASETTLLKRLDLEFRSISCDCGESWTPSDPHNLVLRRLKEIEKGL